MKIFFCLLLLFCHCTLTASDKTRLGELAAASVTTAIGSSLSRPDVAIAKSIICGHRLSKGAFGERLVAENIISKVLSDGKWKSISPRMGPQGIDHIFLKLDPKTNLPKSLMVGESKFGTSRLGDTKDGKQMSLNWTNKRLHALGKRYLDLANVKTVARMPKYPHYELNVTLKNGKEVSFWKSSSNESWKFSGDSADLEEAIKRAKATGNFLIKASVGDILYKRRAFHIYPEGNDVKITIKDAGKVGKGASLANLPTKKTITLQGVLNEKLNPNLKGEIIGLLKNHFKNYKIGELEILADALVVDVKQKALLKNYGYMLVAKDFVLPAAATAGIAMAFDVGVQLLADGNIDVRKTLLTGGATTTGVLVAQSLKVALRNNILAGSVASKLGLPFTFFNTCLSSTGGAIAAAAIFSYGSYYLGYSDLNTANREMFASVVGIGVGSAAAMGTMALIGTFGTSSTGVAIASLHGAAYANAILAWFGGGSVAAGGGGVSLGATILSGGTIIVAIATTAAVYYAYHRIDISRNNAEIERRIRILGDSSYWDRFSNCAAVN